MKPSDRLECLVAARSLRRGGTTEEAITLTQKMCAWVEAQADADAAIAVVKLLGSDAASPLKGDGPLRALDNLYRFATNQTEEVGNSASVSAAPTTSAAKEPETPTSRRGRKPKIRD